MFLSLLGRERQNLGIDLGNNNTWIAGSKTESFSQPSWVAFNRATQRLDSFGERAFDVFGKNSEKIETIKPLSGGVIANHKAAKIMVNAIVKKALNKQTSWFGFQNLISGVPLHTTDVERNAFMDAVDQFSAQKRFLMFEPIAAAMGLGLNIHENKGKLVMDIGGGITEVVIISLCGVVTYRSAKIGGDTMDEAICEYLRKNYKLQIGIKSAERLKQTAGAVLTLGSRMFDGFMVQGKDLNTGLPVQRRISRYDILDAIDPIIQEMEFLLFKALEECPPALASDIFETGIHVTGGCSQLPGLRQRLMQKTKLPVFIDGNKRSAVSLGIEKAMGNTQHYSSVLID